MKSTNAQKIPLLLPVVILGAWLLIAYTLFLLLPSSKPERGADAVVVLAGSPFDRMPVAVQLVQTGTAPTLVVSTVDSVFKPHTDKNCRVPGVAVAETLCFSPSPVNTRGEAAGIAYLIDKYNWKNVVIVTSRYHAARAGLLISQCMGANVEVVASEPDLTIAEWVFMAVEESAGLMHALLQPECR